MAHASSRQQALWRRISVGARVVRGLHTKRTIVGQAFLTLRFAFAILFASYLLLQRGRFIHSEEKQGKKRIAWKTLSWIRDLHPFSERNEFFHIRFIHTLSYNVVYGWRIVHKEPWRRKDQHGVFVGIRYHASCFRNGLQSH